MEKNEYEHYQMQEHLQNQQLNSQQAVYAPQLAEQVQQTQAVLVNQTNPSKIVDNIMLRLRGKRLLDNGQEVDIAAPRLNDRGIESIWFILDSHINQNVIFSHLTAEEIGKIMVGLSEDLVDDLAINWKLYGIKNKTDLDMINDSILTNVFMALKRAEGQNEKNWLGKISIENISGGSSMPKPKQDSFWGKFRL